MDRSLIINEKEFMNIVIVGHVDHGKSTIIGRLLYETGSLPEGKIEQLKESCRRNAKPFEYAFLLDALKDEQNQGITIDMARCFFKTNKRDYIIIDAPGHIEFLKNMITGASRAQAALLVIDAFEGVKENSTRHGYMLSMLGIKQIIILVNKMDLVDYNQDVYNSIVKEYSQFLEQASITVLDYIPVSGFHGDNISVNSQSMEWYKGKTILDALDGFAIEKLPEHMPFRMPVQAVYKFTNNGDNRRIVAGTVDTGSVSVNDEITFFPSGKKGVIKTIEVFNSETVDTVSAGLATGFTLKEQIYITRGEIATKSNEPKPKITTRLRTNIFWLGKQALIKGVPFLLKIGTAKVVAKLEDVIKIINASNLSKTDKDQVDKHDIAEVVLKLDRAIAFDLVYDNPFTSRFVLIHNYEIVGGGIILEDLLDSENWVREKVIIRNAKWESSLITKEQRAERYNQKSKLIIISGPKASNKKGIAKTLERTLFYEGKYVYYLGIGSVLYGVDADIKTATQIGNPKEHFRRLAEISNILLDTGTILIVTATNLTNMDLDIFNAVIGIDKISIVWLGQADTDISYDLHINDFGNEIESIYRIKKMLKDNGVIFNSN